MNSRLLISASTLRRRHRICSHRASGRAKGARSDTARPMLLADRSYDANWIRALAVKKDAWASIPQRCNRSEPICFSPYLYRARNLVEQFASPRRHGRGAEECPRLGRGSLQIRDPHKRRRGPKGRGLHDREHAQAGTLTSSAAAYGSPDAWPARPGIRLRRRVPVPFERIRPRRPALRSRGGSRRGPAPRADARPRARLTGRRP